MNGIFPDDSAERKEYPVYSGFIQYFPAAIAKIAHHSYKGNQKHNPGQPLNHDRAKSDDEPDALCRHLIEDDLVGMAWRAMSMLQKHCEDNGAPIAPAARNAKRTSPPVIQHGVAKLMQRDGVMPPNCDGNATFAPMPAFDPSEGMCYSPDFGADEPALRANPLGRDEE